MKIAVAYKWAANPQEASVRPDGSIDWSRAKAGISEYDLPAIELGRQFADASGGELIGISVGGTEVASPMAKKTALSRSLDALALIADERLGGADSLTTALVLADLVGQLGGIDLLLAGDSSVDVGAQLVPAILAGALGWPMLAQVSRIETTPGGLRVERNHQGGRQTLEVAGPVVLAVAPDAASPRVPGMKDILAAGKKPATQLPFVPPSAGEPFTTISTARPGLAARKLQIGQGAQAAATVATALKASVLG